MSMSNKKSAIHTGWSKLLQVGIELAKGNPERLGSENNAQINEPHLDFEGCPCPKISFLCVQIILAMVWKNLYYQIRTQGRLKYHCASAHSNQSLSVGTASVIHRPNIDCPCHIVQMHRQFYIITGQRFPKTGFLLTQPINSEKRATVLTVRLSSI